MTFGLPPVEVVEASVSLFPSAKLESGIADDLMFQLGGAAAADELEIGAWDPRFTP
jgi:hypothetical protein